ncbi:MAG: nitroreductase [Deltaproteobacteria bacterium]|nr:nitroreductase [Deltaproteobacteria bacterium]
MEVAEAIKARKSVRGFLDKPVAKELIEKVLQLAVRAPSAMNTQPWEFYVLAGDVLDAVRKENVEWLRASAPPQPDHLVVGWPKDSVYRRRQVDLAKQLFSAMGIEREDKEARAAWLERGFRYFDAPAAILVLTDRCLTDAGPLMDLGAMLQTLCLAATGLGLGTCIEDQGVMYPDILRKIAGVPEDKRIMMSVAIGWPDPDFPANKIEIPRVPASEITTWFGFDTRE